MAVIEAQGLTKRFGDIVAVDHIELKVEEGEVFGFLGPNGAGKTTTINMLTTLYKPDDGWARVAGFDVVKEAAKVRSVIGLVPQDLTADEELTGWENVMLYAKLYGVPKQEARERAKALLELLELEEAANRLAKTYSGGMRKRLELAIGLINEPRVLFLDEPTLGLDVHARAAIWEYIKSLNREKGITIFLTTHYLEEADRLSDRLAIIDRGRVVAAGKPNELKSQLRGDVIELVVAAEAAGIEQTLKRVAGVLAVDVRSTTVRAKVIDGEKALPALLRALTEAGVKIESVTLTKPTLDEIFLELTGRRIEEAYEEAFDARRFRAIMRRVRR